MRAAKAGKRLALADVGQRAPAWQPPPLRRILVVIDFDTGTPRIKMMQLWRSSRSDTYRVRTPRGESRRPMGWSRVLAVARKGLPRIRAEAC